MAKRFFVFMVLLMALGSVAIAQDDDLPPPTSKPKPPEEKKDDEGDFKGFKTKKKVNLSDFIIEPNINLSITSGRIDFGLSPYVGYRLWKELYGGAGVTYFYTGFRNIAIDGGNGYTYYANANWHTFGGGVFLQYNVWRGFFARAKFEVLHRRLDDLYGGANVIINSQNNTYRVVWDKKDITTPDLLVGVGYNMLQSKNFFFPIMVSYNLLHSLGDPNYSIYPRGLVVQLGFVNIF